MQYLHFQNLRLPLYETANLTFWRSFDDDGIPNVGCQQLQDVQFLNESEVVGFFDENRVYGLVGVLARNYAPRFYLIIVPTRLSFAKVVFIPKSPKTENLNKNLNSRCTLYGKNFSKQGQFAISNTLTYDLFLTKCNDTFPGIKIFRKLHDYVLAECIWDSYVFDKPMAEVLSKKKNARELRKRKQIKTDLFCDDPNDDAHNTRSLEPRPESHILPNDIVNLLDAEMLNSNDKVPGRNSIKSRDSGGTGRVVSAVEQQSDSAKIYLSDYHIASEVKNAYATVHNQASLLAGKEKLERFLIDNGHEKGSKSFDRAVGAVSDKYFEGIEHRMQAENPLPHKFTDIKLDIDQVIDNLYFK